MYAIIENGGKQYKAVEGGYIEVDLLPDEVGKKKKFDKILLLSSDGKIEVGAPFLKSVSVDTTILSHFKGPKITVFKYRPKQRYRVKTGHRQRYTRVLVDSIVFPGKSAATKKSDETAKKKAETPKKKPTSTTKKAAPAAKTTARKPASKKPAASKAKSSAVKKSTGASKKPAASKTSSAKKPAASTKRTSQAKKPAAAAKKTTTKKKTTSTAKKTTVKKKPASTDKK